MQWRRTSKYRGRPFYSFGVVYDAVHGMVLTRQTTGGSYSSPTPAIFGGYDPKGGSPNDRLLRDLRRRLRITPEPTSLVLTKVSYPHSTLDAQLYSFMFFLNRDDVHL